MRSIVIHQFLLMISLYIVIYRPEKTGLLKTIQFKTKTECNEDE